MAAKTTRRRMGTLRGFGRWLGVGAPLGDYSAPTPARQFPHPLKEGIDGVLKMLRYSDEDDKRCLIALCGLCGLRVGEAVSTLATDIDFYERTLAVHGKGNKERIVPVSSTVIEVVAPRLVAIAQQQVGRDDHLVPLHERTARKYIKKLGERAGISREVSSHDLRATFATAAYDRTKDLRAVQELMGHADSKTTEVYTGVTMQKMREASDVA